MGLSGPLFALLRQWELSRSSREKRLKCKIEIFPKHTETKDFLLRCIPATYTDALLMLDSGFQTSAFSPGLLCSTRRYMLKCLMRGVCPVPKCTQGHDLCQLLGQRGSLIRPLLFQAPPHWHLIKCMSVSGCSLGIPCQNVNSFIYLETALC